MSTTKNESNPLHVLMVREEQASGNQCAEISDEYRANIPPMTATIPPILSERKEQNPTQWLSKNRPDSAQVKQ